MTDTKLCALSTCGKPITRPARMSQQSWDLRRYCNRGCQAGANSLRYPPPTDTKPCSHCGAVMTRRREDGPAKWEEKLYCSRDCARDARRGNAPVDPPPVPVEVIPRVVPTAPRPVWRPPGWSPQPDVRSST
jgi:hypothetical protein